MPATACDTLPTSLRASSSRLSDDVRVRQMTEQAVARLSGFDGWSNNAAYFREVRLTEFEMIDPGQWDRLFAVIVIAPGFIITEAPKNRPKTAQSNGDHPS